MGVLTKLLTLPVSGPVAGAVWVARQVHEAAEAQVNDPAAIRRELAALEVELEAGRLDEAAFEAREMVLLQRLRSSRMAGGAS